MRIRTAPWGLADIQLTYDPPVQSAAELAPVREEKADGPDLAVCWKQPEPARKLVNLQGIPILIVTTESSQHAVYDHCTSKYLAQAGVPNTFVRLEDVGIRGNGHMLMIEKNNLEIAEFIATWVEKSIH